jgi:pimeloyl-ACP methyl ester carboxylesterase
LVLLPLLWLTMACHSRFGGRHRLRFTYLTRELPVADYQQLATAGWVTDQLEVEPGLVLRGLLRKPRSQAARWIVFYPGNEPAPLQAGKDVLSRLARERDFGLAVYAYRGYDGSGGTPKLADLVDDAARVWEHVRQSQRLSTQRMFVAGFSLGGHLAASVAAESNRRARPAAGLLLLAPADDIVMLRRSPWQRLLLGDDCQTRPLLGDVPSPVLVIQGAADKTLNGASQGRAIAESLGARARYEELPGAGHQELLRDERAFELARSYLAGIGAN